MNINVSQFSLKHRPQRFSDVRGQDLVVKELSARAAKGNWPTAMLFQGQTGVGKTTLGFITAATIQCSSPSEKGPCGGCASCKDIFGEKFALGSTHMLDGATSSKDDVIDRIRDTSHTLPFNGKKHVFIIEEVDQLSPAAKNAFHKLLEKPSPYVHFILLSMTEANGNRVPESIATRCQTYHLKPLTETDVAYTMRDVLKAEELWNELPAQFKKEGLFLLANNANGSMRRALQNLERVITGELFETAAIEEAFHFVSEESSLSILRQLLLRDPKVLADLEVLRAQNRLMDWAQLTFYFVVTYMSEALRDLDPGSPASKLLAKHGKETARALINELYDPIFATVRSQGYISNTALLYFFIQYLSTPAAPAIRTRGSSSN